MRKQTVKPVFGEVLGFHRFSLRGHAKVSLEWTLISVSDNFKRLFTRFDNSNPGPSGMRDSSDGTADSDPFNG